MQNQAHVTQKNHNLQIYLRPEVPLWGIGKTGFPECYQHKIYQEFTDFDAPISYVKLDLCRTPWKRLLRRFWVSAENYFISSFHSGLARPKDKLVGEHPEKEFDGFEFGLKLHVIINGFWLKSVCERVYPSAYQ